MGRAPGSIDLKKQRRVLDTAAILFAERGRSVSMTAIAKRSGVARQTIYNHFGGKDALLDALAAPAAALRLPGLEPSATGSPEAILATYAARLLAWAHEAGRFTTIRARLRAADGRQDAAGFDLLRPDGALRDLTGFLQREAHRGRLAVDTPRAAAELFLDLVLGRVQLAVLAGGLPSPSPDDMAQHARRCARLFVRGHAARVADAVPPIPARSPEPRTVVRPPPPASHLPHPAAKRSPRHARSS